MDAFPVERLRLMDGKVAQKYVTLDENNKWVELWDDPTQEVKELLDDMKENLEYEFLLQEDAEEPLNPEALKLQKKLDESLTQGAIINIDYGRNGPAWRKDQPAIRHFGDHAGRKEIEALDLPHSDLLRGYYNPGNVDITADVNFGPLIAQARKDGLNASLEGSQREFLLAVGTRDLAKQYHEALKSAPSWDDYSSLSQALYGFAKVMGEYHSPFYSTVLTKGIDRGALQFKQITDEDNRQLDTPHVLIDVGKPNTAITITLPEKTLNLA